MSLNQHKELREDVKKLVYKEQLYDKIKMANTYYISLSTEKIAGDFNNFSIGIPTNTSSHIKTAKITITDVLISSATGNFGTNQNIIQRGTYIQLSCLRNNCYSPDGANATNATDVVSKAGFYPEITLNTRQVASGTVVSSIYNAFVGQTVIGENPFGQTLNVRLYNRGGAILFADSTLADAVFQLTIKVELIPDFNENDRLTN